MYKTSEIPTDAKSIFANLEHHFFDFQPKIVLSHHGDFNNELINSLSETLEGMLIYNACSPATIRRMFSVVLEGLQNICLCSKTSENGKRFGHIMIKEIAGLYYVSIGNVIDKKEKASLLQHIHKLNKMKLEELKDYYSKNLYLKNVIAGHCAHRGINAIALKSKSKIDCQFIQIGRGDDCYFEMIVSFT